MVHGYVILNDDRQYLSIEMAWVDEARNAFVWEPIEALRAVKDAERSTFVQQAIDDHGKVVLIGVPIPLDQPIVE